MSSIFLIEGTPLDCRALREGGTTQIVHGSTLIKEVAQCFIIIIVWTSIYVSFFLSHGGYIYYINLYGTDDVSV